MLSIIIYYLLVSLILDSSGEQIRIWVNRCMACIYYVYILPFNGCATSFLMLLEHKYIFNSFDDLKNIGIQLVNILNMYLIVTLKITGAIVH